ncbi:MAG TPA: hypothetical protein VHP58_00265 [Alphaproteobacteria bacterium]|nr:hypothetical protein [Alphaproteobacteria bacterium]
MKNKHTLIALAAFGAAPLLSGCFTTLAMKGMNGPGACPADLMPIASANAYALQTATAGDPTTVLPDPQQKENILLTGGQSSVEIWYYRTGHALCPYMPSADAFTMVLVDTQRGSILGIGKQAVAAYRPYMQHGPTYAPHDTGSNSIIEDLIPFS